MVPSILTWVSIVMTIVSTSVSVLSTPGETPPLLLISFDGFRWDYLTRAELPNIKRATKQGVHATEGVKNVFDTSTLANHWTLVTGLYPESHGIVGNYLRDRDIDKKFIPKYVDSKYQNDPRYYDDGGEPIWATNQFQGGRSGSVMWWGSENNVKYSRPTYQMAYDDDVNSTHRVDVMMDWFTNSFPVNLGLIYFPQPDQAGHMAGPESPLVTQKIKETDELVGYIFDRLSDAGMLGHVNIILTSDHGMTSTSKETLIFLDDIINIEDYDITMPDYAHASIFPYEGKLDKVFNALRKASERPDSHFRVYLNKDIPERFHMKNNERAAPIVALADLHYRLVANASRDGLFPLAGTHGYDNNEPDMRPFFVAMGPSFKKDFTVPSFEIVDMYPLMCLLLGIEPAPNNGSLGVVSMFVSEKTVPSSILTYIFYTAVANGVALLGVFAVVACKQHGILKRKTN